MRLLSGLSNETSTIGIHIEERRCLLQKKPCRSELRFSRRMVERQWYGFRGLTTATAVAVHWVCNLSRRYLLHKAERQCRLRHMAAGRTLDFTYVMVAGRTLDTCVKLLGLFANLQVSRCFLTSLLNFYNESFICLCAYTQTVILNLLYKMYFSVLCLEI